MKATSLRPATESPAVPAGYTLKTTAYHEAVGNSECGGCLPPWWDFLGGGETTE